MTSTSSIDKAPVTLSGWQWLSIAIAILAAQAAILFEFALALHIRDNLTLDVSC